MHRFEEANDMFQRASQTGDIAGVVASEGQPTTCLEVIWK